MSVVCTNPFPPKGLVVWEGDQAGIGPHKLRFALDPNAQASKSG